MRPKDWKFMLAVMIAAIAFVSVVLAFGFKPKKCSHTGLLTDKAERFSVSVDKVIKLNGGAKASFEVCKKCGNVLSVAFDGDGVVGKVPVAGNDAFEVIDLEALKKLRNQILRSMTQSDML